MDAFTGKAYKNPYGRHLSIFGGKSTYNDSLSRKDKESQAQFRSDIDANRKITANKPQSSRYQEKGDDTLFGPNSYEDGMKEVSVASTAIDSFDYNPKTGDLDVQFVGGSKKYRYPKVPKEVVTEFMESPSKGRYMNYYIAPSYSENR